VNSIEREPILGVMVEAINCDMKKTLKINVVKGSKNKVFLLLLIAEV